MGNITTLDRLKDHMWEEDRELFREHNMYHLLRLMFRLNACVDFKLKQVSDLGWYGQPSISWGRHCSSYC